MPVDGVFSIATAVDDRLPGGLAAASDADVKRALSEILDETSPEVNLRSTLSQLTTSNVETIDGQTLTVWRSPAFQAEVAYLRNSFDIDHPDGNDDMLINAAASDVCLSCHAEQLGAVFGFDPLVQPPELGGGAEIIS